LGAGGFGKTTIAAELCHDEDIVENFDDGILWVTLEQTPDVLATLLTAYAALTGERPGFASEADSIPHIRPHVGLGAVRRVRLSEIRFVDVVESEGA
jgi:hypothetical protein